MIQEIIASLIVVAAVVVAVILIYRRLKNPLRDCEGCSNDCSSCKVLEIKKKMEEKKNLSR